MVQIIQINLVLKNGARCVTILKSGSNNTNKLSPQERKRNPFKSLTCSNNTNKLSPQEHTGLNRMPTRVQIIQINLVLKNKALAVPFGVAFK